MTVIEFFSHRVRYPAESAVTPTGRRPVLVMTLEAGECIVPSASQMHSWTAPNGVKVVGSFDGWNHSFHAARYHPGNVWVTTTSRHVGPARRALRAFAAQFVRLEAIERYELRRLVRSGDD